MRQTTSTTSTMTRTPIRASCTTCEHALRARSLRHTLIPFIACEIPIGQNVCELVFGVDVFDLDLGVQINSIQQPIKSNSMSSGNMSHCRTSALQLHCLRTHTIKLLGARIGHTFRTAVIGVFSVCFGEQLAERQVVCVLVR